MTHRSRSATPFLLATLAALGVGGGAARAESGPLTVTASVRLRTESLSGQFRPAPAPANDTMVSLRTAIAAEYDAGPVRFGAELWDARSGGQDRASTAGTGEVNALELVQAHAKVELGGTSTITLGRFTMDLGSRRLVARQRFRNTTNAFTGAHLALAPRGGARLDAFWAMPQVRLPDDPAGIRADRVAWDRESTDLMFYGLHASVPRGRTGSMQAYAYGLAERDSSGRQTRNRRLWTVGARLVQPPAPGHWDHDLEAAWQGGRARRSALASDLADLRVRAWFVHAEAGRTLAGGWHPRLAVQFDAASGDTGKAGTFGRFDTLYGGRRFEYGPNGLYGPFARANMLSPSVRVEITPSRRTDAFVAWRSAWLGNRRDAFAATGVRDPRGLSGRFAGHQIEGRVRHWIVPGRLQVDAGAALLVKRGVLRDAPNAPATGDTRYGYIDLTLSL